MKPLALLARYALLTMFVASLVHPAYGQQVEVTATLVEPGKSILPETNSTAPATVSTSDSKTKIQFASRTIPTDTSIALTGAGEGSKLVMPAGLTMTAPTWNGTVDVSYTTTVPPLMTGIASGKAVSIQFTGMEGKPVKLDSAAVVVIPYSNFSAVSNPIVQITDMANVVHTLSLCTSTQYITGTLSNPSNYSLQAYDLSGAQHCYKYDNTNVYIATNHFSTFMAGTAAAPAVAPAPIAPVAPVSSASSGGGGSSGNSYQLVSSTPTPPAGTKSIPSCVFAMIPPKYVYDDVSLNTWYSAAVTNLANLGILKKKKINELFKPSGKLRRYEALILTMDAFGIKPEKKSGINAFSKYVKKAKEMGIIVSEKPRFLPLGTMSRAETVALLLRAAKVNPEEYTKDTTTKQYKDVKKNQWYFSFIMKASDLCIVASNTNMFLPKKAVTRAEFVVILDRAIQKLKK